MAAANIVLQVSTILVLAFIVFVVLLLLGSVEDFPVKGSLSTSKTTTTSSISAEKMPQHTYPRDQCHISVSGSDGIGHQMEAKLTALATAVMLNNVTYVHQPLTKTEHGTNSAAMEKLFAFSESLPLLSEYAVMYNEPSMNLTTRKPLPYIGKCNQKSWFDDYQKHCGLVDTPQNNTVVDKNSKVPVWTADNTWDYFWCHTDSLSDEWWEKVVPTLRNNILQGLSSASTTNNHTRALRIVMHMRLGDTGSRRSKGPWSTLVVQNLIKAAESAGHDPIDVIIHSDVRRWKVRKKIKSLDTSKMTIYGRNSKGATVERALHDMITADVFVAAESSLSNVAAMLRGQDKGAVIHPEDSSRAGMVMLGWSMLRTTEDEQDLEVCLKATMKSESRCQEWAQTNQTFWSTILVP